MGKVQKKTKLPLVVDNDRSAYVLGEQWCGIAKNLQDVVFLAVGTGIGAGIISGGKLCRGCEDISGAVGWFALNPDFRKEYGEKGCFEAEASGTGVAKNAARLLKKGEPSIMEGMVEGQWDNLTAEMVFEAARKNDRVAQTVVDSAVKYLAMGIANIVSILNPEMIVLGGGLFQAGNIL